MIPGIGDAGEIRFYCDRCARNHRVKMRYWDGRDLDVGGHRENPDLGDSFHTLILSFEDVIRMRKVDLNPVIQEAVLAMEFSASTEDLQRTIHGHPTLSEALHEAALAVDNRAINAINK